MLSIKRLVVGASVVLAAAGAWASNYRAADTVYLPAVARIPINATSIFKTDVVITNMTSDSVRVDMAIATGTNGAPIPGLSSSSDPVNSANLRPAGGLILAPHERKEIRDLIATEFGVTTGSVLGQAILFACRNGGNCSDCDTDGGDCDLITAESRIYTDNTSGCANGAADCTVGQLFSGIPWYFYVAADSTGVANGVDSATIVGLRNEGAQTSGGSASSGFRSNLGFANASNVTSVTLLVNLFQNSAPTTVFAHANVTLGPLGQQQSNMKDLFSGVPTGFDGFVTVSVASFVDHSTDNSGFPAFFAYGSILDNTTNDATTLESQFLVEPSLDCIFGAKTNRHAIARTH